MRNRDAESRSDISTIIQPVSRRVGTQVQGFQENPNCRLFLKSRYNRGKGRRVKDSGCLKFRKTEKGDTENKKHILFPLHSFTLVAVQYPRAEFLSLYCVSVPL